MFDSKEPQDIFAGTDKPPVNPAPAAPTNLPVEGVAPVPRMPAPAPRMPMGSPIAPAVTTPTPMQYEESAPRRLGLKTLFFVLLALLLVAAAAYAAYAFVLRPSPAVYVPDTSTVTTPEAETPAEVTPEETTPAEETPVNPSFLDSDGDGLTNAEELEAGTSSSNPDTDGDGLGDREEVKVYGTDPRRTDTDGDGYLDGAEVDGGYNPNGPGRLLQIPTP